MLSLEVTYARRQVMNGEPSNKCPGSMAFPTTYNGEFTRCPKCGRKLKLHINGLIPKHNKPEHANI